MNTTDPWALDRMEQYDLRLAAYFRAGGDREAHYARQRVGQLLRTRPFPWGKAARIVTLKRKSA